MLLLLLQDEETLVKQRLDYEKTLEEQQQVRILGKGHLSLGLC